MPDFDIDSALEVVAQPWKWRVYAKARMQGVDFLRGEWLRRRYWLEQESGRWLTREIEGEQRCVDVTTFSDLWGEADGYQVLYCEITISSVPELEFNITEEQVEAEAERFLEVAFLRTMGPEFNRAFERAGLIITSTEQLHA